MTVADAVVAGERKTLRIVAKYADACNFIGEAATVNHKMDVLRRHCDQGGRDPAEVEVTALVGLPEDAQSDAILREADALNAAGAHTIVVRPTGSQPSRWLEETWGPVVPELASIG